MLIIIARKHANQASALKRDGSHRRSDDDTAVDS